MSAFDKWPFTNESNPFDTDEFRDAMTQAAEAGGMVNSVRGDARVGVQAGIITGGINISGGGQTVIGGRLVNNGVAKTCTTCKGTRGWVIADGMEIHTGNGCGARQ